MATRKGRGHRDERGPARALAGGAGDQSTVGAGARPHGPSYLWWFAVSLAVLVFLPGMWSGNFAPKLFWAILTVGLGWFSVRPDGDASGVVWRVSPLGLIWLLYLAWALLSLTWAIQPRVGLERWLILALWGCAYLLAQRTRFWESEPFWLLFQVLVGLVSAIGCLQFLAPDFPGLAGIPASGLPSSTLGHRNYAAMYLVVTLPFVVWRLYRARGWGLLLPAVALGLGLAFLLFTRSRQAWLAMAVAVVFVLAAGGAKRVLREKGRTKRLVWGSALLVLAASLVPASGRVFRAGWRAMPSEKRSVVETIANTFREKGDVRLQMWRPALRLVDPRDYPRVFLHGFGFGNFPIASTPHNDQVRSLDYEIHNDYLQALLDLGLPGAILFTLFFAWTARLAWRARRRGLVLAAGGAAVGLAVVQFFTFTSENVSPLVWMAGVAAILNGQGRDRPVFERPVPAWAARAVRPAVALLLAVFCAVVGFAIWAERQFWLERETRPNPDFHRLASRVMPRMQFNANIAFIQAHECAAEALGRRDLRSAEAFARKALSLNPNDWGALEVLGAVAGSAGNPSEAIAFLERAVALAAHAPSPRIWLRLRDLYLRSGRRDDAKAAAGIAQQKVVAKPSRPSPADGAIDVPVDFALDWDDAPNAEKYDVYLWKEGDPFPKFPQAYHVRRSRVKWPMRARPATDYQWMVKTFGPTGRVAGDVWRFRTAGEGPGAGR